MKIIPSLKQFKNLRGSHPREGEGEGGKEKEKSDHLRKPLFFLFFIFYFLFYIIYFIFYILYFILFYFILLFLDNISID